MSEMGKSTGGDSISADDVLSVIIKCYKELREKHEKLKEENEKLKKCVEFYADRTMWQFSAHNNIYKNWTKTKPQDQDLIADRYIFGGKIARQTLKELTAQ